MKHLKNALLVVRTFFYSWGYLLLKRADKQRILKLKKRDKIVRRLSRSIWKVVFLSSAGKHVRDENYLAFLASCFVELHIHLQQPVT